MTVSAPVPAVLPVVPAVPVLALPPASFANVPVTVIVWADGGRTERHGHLTPEDITERYGARETVSVTWTTTADLEARGANLYLRPEVVVLFGKEPKV